MKATPRPAAIGAIARAFFTGLVRDRTGMFFVVVLPVVIIVIIGSVFGAPDTGEVGVLDQDHSALSGRLTDELVADDSVSVRRYRDERTLRRDVRTGRVDAGLLIPAGLDDEASAGRQTATVALVTDPASQSAAAVRPAIDDALTSLGQEVTVARFAVEVTGADPSAAADAVNEARGAIIPVEVVTATVGDSNEAGLSSFSYTAPSNMVLFVFVNSLAAAGAMVESRRRGLTRRMLAAPVTIGTILLGSGATQFLFTLVQATLIIVVGALLFDVSWGSPAAAASLVVLWALVSTGGGLLIGALARTGDQAQSVAAPAAIALGMLGGCMWPLEVVGDTMRQVGHATPHAWAMDAWVDLIFDGEGFGAIAPELAVLAGFGAVLLAAGTLALRRAVTRA